MKDPVDGTAQANVEAGNMATVVLDGINKIYEDGYPRNS